jgi:hypothetical protein
MNRLPQTIVELNDALGPAARFALDRPASDLRRRLLEKDYDALIVQSRDVIAELLRDDELIAQDSKLKYLGRQIANLDVLFAETGPDEEFRRLVIVEDKLLRNPEARRTVLAQILDYAHKLQYDLTADQLIDALDDQLQEWAADNRDEIESSLRIGDCLLLIFGDEIHARVATLAERFAKQANPLSRCEVALVAMNLYSDGARHLLIPTIFGAAARFERDLTIQVRVVDAQDRPVPALTRVMEDEAREHEGASEEEFFRVVWGKFSAEDIAACKRVLQRLEACGIPGLRRATRRDGRPVIIITDTRWGDVTVLWVARTVPVIRDSLELNSRLKNDAEAVRIWTSFRRALVEAGGTMQRNGRVYVPVAQLTEGRCGKLIASTRSLAAALRGDMNEGQRPD